MGKTLGKKEQSAEEIYSILENTADICGAVSVFLAQSKTAYTRQKTNILM